MRRRKLSFIDVLFDGRNHFTESVSEILLRRNETVPTIRLQSHHNYKTHPALQRRVKKSTGEERD